MMPIHTDAEGRFRIPHPADGEAFTLELERLGYAPVTSELDFDRGEEVSLEVRMSADAFELEPMVVTARRRGMLADEGFYDRKDRGLGHFIEREEIERRVPTRATDILRGTPAIRLADIGGGRRDVRLNVQTTFGHDCEPRIFVDGMLARGGGVVELDEKSAPERSLDFVVNITDVEAIEVYARTSAVPAQHGGLDTACGVIVVWTRRN